MRCHLNACLVAWVLALVLALSACSSSPQRPAPALIKLDSAHATDVVLQALSLIDVEYVFGGRNPEAGVDCSGMVSLVFENAAGIKLPHNAAQIAQLARPVDRDALRPGDLVFFNTQNSPFSHVGVYIGEGRFIHAPSSRGAVKIDNLSTRYFSARFEGGRTLFGQ